MREPKRVIALGTAVAALALLAAVQLALADATPPSQDQASGARAAEDGWPPVYRVALIADLTTTNYWAYLGRDSSASDDYVLGTTVHSLFSLTDQDYDYVPRLAADYGSGPVQVDGSWLITVPLKQGIYWSDGTPFTATDVVFTLKTCAELGLEGDWLKHCPDALADVTADGDHTVTYHFTREVGLGTWGADVSLAPILPRHYWEPIVEQAKAQQDPSILYDKVPVNEPVLGPFKLRGWLPGFHVELARNPRYYFQGLEVRHYANGAYWESLPGKYTFTAFGPPTGPVELSFKVGPHVKGVRYLIYASDAEAYQALQNGEVDVVLNPETVDQGLRVALESDPQVATVRNPDEPMYYMAFNLRRSPMDVPEFRQAVATLIDRGFPGSIVADSTYPLYTFVPEGNRFWYNPNVPRTGQGLTRQERISDTVDLLTSAGFTWTVEPDWDPGNEQVIPGQGLHYMGEPVAEIELFAPNFDYDPIRATEALSIEQWLDEAGISVTTVLTEFQIIVDRVFSVTVDFDTYILGWLLEGEAFPRYFESFWHSRNNSATTGNFNSPGYSNPLYDAVCDQFMATPDREQAQSLAFTMQVTLATDLPYVTLHNRDRFDAYRADKITFPYTVTLSGLEGQAGMPALVRPVAESVVVDPETGGTLTYTDTQGLTTSVLVPPGAVTETTTFVFEPLISPTQPLSPDLCFAGHAFDLNAYCTVETSIYLPLVLRGYPAGPVPGGLDVTGPQLLFSSSGTQGPRWTAGSPAQGDLGPCETGFGRPITITINYSDADVSCLSDESSLLLYYWTGSEWADAATTCVPPSAYLRDLVGNSIGLPICHLTQYAIGGK